MAMTENVETVLPTAALVDAARLLARRGIRHLPVVAHGSGKPRLVGILAAHDVVHAFPPDVNPFAPDDSGTERVEARVEDAMTTQLVRVGPNVPLEEAAALMRSRKIGALPVVDKEGDLLGILTESDLLRTFASVLEMPPGTLRVTVDAAEGNPLPALLELAQQHGLRLHGVLTFDWERRPCVVVQVSGQKQRAFVRKLRSFGERVLSIQGDAADG